MRHGRDDRTRAALRITRLCTVLLHHHRADLFQHRPVHGDGLLDRDIGEPGVGPGAERPGLDGQHLYTGGAQLFAEHLGDRLQRGFTCAVIPETRHPVQPGDRGHVDDPAAVAGPHSWQHRPQDREHREEVQLERRPHPGIGHAFDGSDPAAPGIVDHDVDATEALLGDPDRFLHLTGVGDVERHDQHPVLVSARPLVQFGGTPGRQHHPVTDLQGRLGERDAEATGGPAGDEPVPAAHGSITSRAINGPAIVNR